MLLHEIPLVLLSAGASVRMGHLGPKGLLTYQGVPWFLWQAKQYLSAGGQQVIVVLGHHYSQFLPHFQNLTSAISFTLNLQPEHGPFSSIQAGLKMVLLTSPPPAIFIQGVDHPIPQAETLQKMVQAGQHEERDFKAIIPSYRGHKGHPVLITQELAFQFLPLTPEEKEYRLDYQINRLNIEQKKIIDVDDETVLLNINTPSAWEHFLATT